MPETASPLDGLQKQQFISITTFRKSGVGVATPVWFAQVGECLYVWTERNSGKAKRIRNNRRVLVAPSDARGGLLGPAFEAAARLLPEAENGPAGQAMRRKYGLQLGLFRLLASLRRSQHVYLEIRAA